MLAKYSFDVCYRLNGKRPDERASFSVYGLTIAGWGGGFGTGKGFVCCCLGGIGLDRFGCGKVAPDSDGVAELRVWIFAAAKMAHLSDDKAVAKMGHPVSGVVREPLVELRDLDFRCRENTPPFAMRLRRDGAPGS
jgi:hypothetical protein